MIWENTVWPWFITVPLESNLVMNDKGYFKSIKVKTMSNSMYFIQLFEVFRKLTGQ